MSTKTKYIATGTSSGHTIAFQGAQAMKDYLSSEDREDISMVRAVTTRDDKDAYSHAVDSGNEYA